MRFGELPHLATTRRGGSSQKILRAVHVRWAIKVAPRLRNRQNGMEKPSRPARRESLVQGVLTPRTLDLPTQPLILAGWVHRLGNAHLSVGDQFVGGYQISMYSF